MKTIRITVTKQDIANGKIRSNKRCPVALAVRRACLRRGGWQAGLKHVEIGRQFCYLSDQGEIVLPKRARRFIARFDDKESVKPFSFNLRIPPTIGRQADSK